MRRTTDHGPRTLLSFLPPNGVEMRIVRLRPARQRHFLARIELNALVSLDMQIAKERAVPAGEREPGHGGGNAHVDADHAGVEVPLELSRRVTTLRENYGAVAVFALIPDSQSFVEVA